MIDYNAGYNAAIEASQLAMRNLMDDLAETTKERDEAYEKLGSLLSDWGRRVADNARHRETIRDLRDNLIAARWIVEQHILGDVYDSEQDSDKQMLADINEALDATKHYDVKGGEG